MTSYINIHKAGKLRACSRKDYFCSRYFDLQSGHGLYQGSLYDFEFGGEDLENDVGWGDCGHRPQFVLGACPPENFGILSLLRVVLRHSETKLRS